jgi:hypothetical protein
MLRIVLFVLFGSIHLFAWTQSCIPDYIDFYTQGQIDSFQINYPDCTEIEGDVDISGYDISNLSGLLSVTSIGGNLRIRNVSSLITLYGLNNLSSIGEGLRIENNGTLLNLVGLNGLVSIGGSLTVLDNPSLLRLTGLDNLISIGGNLNIGCSNYYWTGNPLLINFNGLSSLTSIGGTFSICHNNSLRNMNGLENLISAGEIEIISNDSLISLSGLQSLTNIYDALYVFGNVSLVNLNGINNLAYAGGIKLIYNDNLTSLTGLESISAIGGDLYIHDNPITSLQPLTNLTIVGEDLNIYDNSSLSTLSGLENLNEINGDLIINENSSLTDITSLSGVNLVGGDLIVTGNNITSLTPLSGITSIGGILEISFNNSLTSLSGIDNINPASIKGLRIHRLANLSDCAFENICEYLANPTGVVDIYWNDYPCNNAVQIANECGITLPCLPYGNFYFFDQADIDNFQNNYPGCTNLGGSVHIWGDGSGNITNLEGLNAITSIDGALSVYNTNSLTSLSGLDNIAASSISDLVFYDNDALSECEVKSVCDYLLEPNGNVEIFSNAPGCDSVAEILFACETISIKENGFEPLIDIYPNPTSHFLHIDNTGGNEIHNIVIYNTFGQKVFYQNYMGPLIDVSALNPGIYILEIIANGSCARIKFAVKD